MSEICARCGLPMDLCVCETIAKEEQKIEIMVTRRRFGKLMTVVSGFDKSINIKDLAKKLKSKLACGGTSKDSTIELQGDHSVRVKELIIEEGFPSNAVTIVREKRK